MKQQSTRWIKKGAAQPQKQRGQKSAKKCSAITFFDKKGMIYTHYVPQGQTVNSPYFIEVLKQLMKVHIARKRLEYKKENWKLHMQCAVLIRLILSPGIELVLHPAYSPDLAPNDFFLYPGAKKDIKGRHFESIQELQTEVQTILQRMLKNGFACCFEQ